MNTENNMIIGNASHGPDGAVAALSTSDPGLPACFYKGVGKAALLNPLPI